MTPNTEELRVIRGEIRGITVALIQRFDMIDFEFRYQDVTGVAFLTGVFISDQNETTHRGGIIHAFPLQHTKGVPIFPFILYPVLDDYASTEATPSP